MNTDQEKNTLKDVCLMNEDLVATISSAEDTSRSNIYISDILSGQTLYCLDNANIQIQSISRSQHDGCLSVLGKREEDS